MFVKESDRYEIKIIYVAVSDDLNVFCMCYFTSNVFLAGEGPASIVSLSSRNHWKTINILVKMLY